MSETGQHRTPNILTRWVIAAVIFMVIITTTAVALAIYGSGENRDKEVAQAGQAQQQGEKKDLAAQIKEICDGGDTAARKELLKKNPNICGQVTQIVKEGPVGPPGEPGAAGPQGPPGPQGPAGRDGITPACVLQANRCVGATGATGAIGPQGVAGKDGVNGKDGLNGKDGEDGAAGPAGPAGKDGVDGTNGTDGAPGPAGPAGPQGIQGPAGEDAFPFTFTFVVPGSVTNGPDRTYTCKVESSTAPASCVQS